MLSMLTTVLGSAAAMPGLVSRHLAEMMPVVGEPLSALFPPMILLALCVAAGIGTYLMLPGRKETTVAKVGAAIGLACGLIFVALLVHKVGGPIGGNISGVYFWLFSGVAIISAIRVVTHPRPVYSALYFVLTVMASAGLFILLWAEFLAVALIIIYAGAILITYVFVIMLAQQSRSDSKPIAGMGDYDANSREPLVASAIGFTMMGVLLFVIFDRAQALPAPPEGVNQPTIDMPYAGSTQILGRYLFEHQLVNLELAGLLLTVSMVGAIVIARRRVVAGEIVETPETDEISAKPKVVSDAPGSIPVYGTTNPRAKAYPES